MTPSSPFPESYTGAVSLSFDDGLNSHLKTAVPLLDEFSLKGTFYVCPADSTPDSGDWKDNLMSWKEVSGRGHEIGNHTLSHTCSRAMRPEGSSGLETLTIEQIEQDIQKAEKRLDDIIGRTDRSFAYPCYLSYVGEGLSHTSFVPVVSRMFAAGRCKAPGASINHPETCALHYLWSYGCERMSGAELIGLCMRALMRRGWTILTFHGINEGHLSVSESDFRELCEFLGKHNPGIWVAPVIDVAKRIDEWRAESSGDRK